MTKFDKTYIIAEAGVNHNADLKLAYKLVDAAKSAGADAVKFQLFKIEEQVSNIAINAPYQQKGSGEQKMKDMAKHYDLEWNEHIKIKKYCDKIGIDYLSSCCDISAIDFLIDKLQAKSIKISSGEITNLSLLRHAASKNVPIILSTGMANFDEIDVAVSTIFKELKSTLILLHCISNYPASESSLNLRIINTLKKRYKLNIGYSDHSLGYKAAIAAIALGAKVIEKHFTISKKLPGPDHSMALEPSELKRFVDIVRDTEIMMGTGNKNISKEEEEMKKIFRRGVITLKNIKKGDILNLQNIGIKRPAIGIDAIHFNQIVGKKILVEIKKDSPLLWNMIEE